MILYLDTSSLVKLYVAELGSAQVRQMVVRAGVVATSVVAFPEARSAFARLAREGRSLSALRRESETGIRRRMTPAAGLRWRKVSAPKSLSFVTKMRALSRA